MTKFVLLVLVSFILTGINDVTAQRTSISSLKFLNVISLPPDFIFANTIVGGLSGIDYDSVSNLYFLISDDRSARNPVRFYTANIFLGEKGIDSVCFKKVQYLFQASGQTFPDSKTDPAHTPDPEAIRWNARTQQLFWTSEGERARKQDKFLLQDPAINICGADGVFMGSFPVPANVRMSELEKGPRQNGSLEGITFSGNFGKMMVSMEEPLQEDGPRADATIGNAWVRLASYDVATARNIAQYAYVLEPVAYAPTPSTAFKVNGISEILSVGDNQLLVVERSFSWGRSGCTIKVFLTDLTRASNILSVSSLKENMATVQCAEKKLLVNMDSLGIYVDNVEGVTFGPKLPNGHDTLVFVSDNNFSALEKTQFLLFEVIP